MGKSTLLQNLIVSDIQAGRGVGLIDPHGDLADTLLTMVPKHRTNDVVLFDAGDRDSPLSFNILACRNVEQRPLVASGIVSAFKKLYFWNRDFAAMHAKLQVEAIAPIQNKVGHFVSSPLTRNIVGQSRSTIDLRRIMDEHTAQKKGGRQLTAPLRTLG